MGKNKKRIRFPRRRDLSWFTVGLLVCAATAAPFVLLRINEYVQQPKAEQAAVFISNPR